MRLFLLFLAGTVVVTAQKAPPPPPAPTSVPSSTTISPVGPVQRGATDFEMQLTVSGRVLIDDRQPPPEPVLVEYICRGASRGALTDAKGRFSIPIGNQQDAGGNSASAHHEVEGCRVQIRIPGYEEILVTLKRPRQSSDLSLGDLNLKPRGLQSNAVFSASGHNAPPKART